MYVLATLQDLNIASPEVFEKEDHTYSAGILSIKMFET